MTIWGTSQIAKPNMGTRVWRPRGGAPVVSWWNPDGATPAGVCLGAYQAKAAASYAASKVNLPTPGVNDLGEGNGAVPWAAITGWEFVAAAAQYFNTGIVPLLTTWSTLIQYTDRLGVTSNTLYGSAVGGNWYFVQPNQAGSVRYFNGLANFSWVPPGHPIGNLGMGGKQPYRDGLPDGALIAAGGPPGAQPIYIGAYNNNGAPAQHTTSYIRAFWVGNITLTAPQMLARAAAMALL